jgi:hypothetical protein
MRRPTGPFTALYTQTLPQRSTAAARGARRPRRRRHQGAAAAVALCVFRAVAAHCTEHCAAVEAAFRAVGVLTD